MKRLHSIFALAGLLAGTSDGLPQGFINLNFEQANVSGYSPESFLSVPASSAFPGWSPLFVSGTGTNIQSVVSYDVLPLSAAAISIGDTNLTQYGLGPIQGRYSAFLFGADDVSAGLSQSALIPVNTESLLMSVRRVTYFPGGSLTVMIGGQLITMTAIQQFSDYTIYGGNIAAFAGQIMPLTIMDVPGSNAESAYGWEIDGIQFSPSPVPEPCGLPLALLGTGLIGMLRWRRSRTGQ